MGLFEQGIRELTRARPGFLRGGNATGETKALLQTGSPVIAAEPVRLGKAEPNAAAMWSGVAAAHFSKPIPPENNAALLSDALERESRRYAHLLELM